MFRTQTLIRTLGLTMAGSIGMSAYAIDLAVFDAAQFLDNGFTFGDFSESGAVGTNDGLLNIDISVDGDGSNGLFGGAGSDVFADFDPVGKNLEVTLRVDPLNTATDFRVVLADTDGSGTGDEFQFFFGLGEATPGEFVTLTQELLNPGPVFVQPGFGQFPGDEIQNYGLTQIQVQSAFGSTEPLRIDLESIKIVDPNDLRVAELSPETYRASDGAFTFGTFSDPGAADTTGETFVINADPAATSGPSGGLGFSGLNVDFDASVHQLEVEAKLLSGNTAENFNLLLGDVDGDDSGPGLGSEDFIFTVDTANFNDSEFTVFTLPLGSGTEGTVEQTFGFTNGGDGLQNFGLSQMQIQTADELGVLNLEIARVTVVEAVIAALAGDFNGSGSVEQADLDLVLTNWGGARTFEDGVTTFGTANVDQEELDIVLTQWGSSLAPSFEGFESVPEPAAVLIGAAGLAVLSSRRRVA